MAPFYLLAEETLGYQTATDPTNTEKQLLIAGSKNVMIDYQKKVVKRSGYTRLGVASPADTLTQNRNAWTWNTSTGSQLPQRFYDDELEVYLGTVDTVVINAWTRVSNGWSTTEKLRAAIWYDATEKIDLQLMVQADANIYEYNGAVAVVGSVTATTITKSGTTTWAQNRFYTTRNMTVVCVRTGTEYTYTGGMTTTTITGISSTAGLVAGDILVQKIVTQSNKPGANRTNHFIYVFENQCCIGSEDDSLVYMSKNTSYTDFTFSSPRAAGEGAILTLDTPTRGFGSIGKLFLAFAGTDYIYRAVYEQISVGVGVAETLSIKRLDVGINKGALNQECIISLGNSIAYLSCEVALRTITNPESAVGLDPKTLSNPIKPDFDAENWTGAFGYWYKSMLIFTAPVTSHMYILNYIETADGKTMRFWNPPQVLPVGPMSTIDSGNGPLLHGHSNSIPESYLLFDGLSDGQYAGMDPADKLPIPAVATFAYDDTVFIRRRVVPMRSALKNFDEYYVEGEITPNTTALELNLNYDYGGTRQQIQRIIDGSDETILQGTVDFNSLAQQSNSQNPLGGLLNPPTDARKFHVVFEMAKEDYYTLGPTFSTEGIDEYWAIIAHGPNATLSTRRDTLIRK